MRERLIKIDYFRSVNISSINLVRKSAEKTILPLDIAENKRILIVIRDLGHKIKLMASSKCTHIIGSIFCSIVVLRARVIAHAYEKLMLKMKSVLEREL